MSNDTCIDMLRYMYIELIYTSYLLTHGYMHLIMFRYIYIYTRTRYTMIYIHIYIYLQNYILYYIRLYIICTSHRTKKAWLSPQWLPVALSKASGPWAQWVHLAPGGRTTVARGLGRHGVTAMPRNTSYKYLSNLIFRMAIIIHYKF